jgi:hypothetical protein
MRGKKTLVAVLVCLGMTVGLRPASAEVQVTMNAGRVTISAKNATVGQILAEWAKVGQTKIVNAERLGGAPMTLELTNVLEVEAIEILLRSAGGYVLAPRHAEAANLSHFDRILVLPASAPSAAARPGPRPAAAPAPQQPRPFAPPPRQALTLPPGQAAAQQASDDTDDQDDRQAPVQAAPPARPPVFNTFPQAAPQPRTDAPAQPAPTSSVTAPVGVSTPGMVVPTPQPAGQQPGTIQPPQQQH